MGLPANSFVAMVELTVDYHPVLEPIDRVGDVFVREDSVGVNFNEQLAGGIGHSQRPMIFANSANLVIWLGV